MEITIVPSEQCPDADLLTLKEVCAQTGWNAERLRGYLDKTPLNGFVGAHPKPGSKGVGYPPDSLAFFAKLLLDADARKVTPTTIAGWLDDISRTAIVPSAQSHNGRTADAIRALSQLPDDRWAVLKQLAEALHRMQPPDDALLTAEQVYVLIPRSPAWLRKHVPSVRLGRAHLWRRSEVLHYITGLPSVPPNRTIVPIAR